MGVFQTPGQPIGLASKTDQKVSQVQRFSNTQEGSEPFGKFSTVLFFSLGYKSLDLTRSAWRRFVLIVQPLQFHYSLYRNSGTFVALILPEECSDESRSRCGVHRDFKNSMMASWSSPFNFSNF